MSSSGNLRRTWTILILIAALVVPAVAVARGGKGACGRGAGGEPGLEGPGHPLGRVVRQLELSEAQRTRVREILLAHRDARQADSPRLRAARETLRRAVHAPQVDEAAIREAAEGLARLHGDRALARARVLSQVRGVLEPEQIRRLDELLAQAPGRGGHGHFRHGGRGARRGAPDDAGAF